MRKTLALLGALCWTAALPARNPGPDYGAFDKPLGKDQQILHALDRLGYGPRPGDVEAVRKMGLKKWIDRQLHPENTAENPELEARLAPLKSLSMSQQEIASNYAPGGQVAAAVQAALQNLKQAQQAKGGGTVLPVFPPIPLNPAIPLQAPLRNQPPAKSLNDLLPQDQVRILRSGTLEQRRALLAKIPADQIDEVITALAPNMRTQLMPAASPELQRKLQLANNPQQVVASDLTEAKLYRAIYSTHQLEEQLTDFWFNHFNVSLDKGADRILTTAYERDAIRPYVLGKFRDLLEATANSPAMMFYLDNWQSVTPPPARPNAKGKQAVRGLNENYARELMELHTLGVDGGYTQHDIIEVARCFTGWTINNPNQGGPFSYNDNTHDKGEKTVLGVTIPAGGGKEDGEKVLDILAAHPSTAKFISKELAQRFVADDPPPVLIAAMAKTFTESGGDIRAVLETMLDSKQFFSQGAYRAKMKTPFETIVSAVRATNANVSFAVPLVNQIATLGQPLYRKLEPTGYSNANVEWVNSASLLARMNFAMQLGQNRIEGVTVDPKRFSTAPAITAKQILFTNATPQTLDAIAKSLAPPKPKKDQKPVKPQPPSPGLIAGLVLGSPDFQRR
jgi:uncharacterized protein (DUF1800 family)